MADKPPPDLDLARSDLAQALAELNRQVLAGQDAAACRDRIAALRRTLRNATVIEPDTMLANRFRLGARLGGSAFAAVYEATDIAAGRPVAIKILEASTAGDPIRRRRFVDGARRLSSIQHDHIATVLEVFDTPEACFFVGELVDGGDLRWLTSHGALSPAVVAQILIAVAGALDMAHGHGIIHRDVKPTNILIDRAGLLHITDFDLLRPEDTPTGLPMGSFAYAAPEQTTHPADVGPPADVFSLGMTGAFLLLGGTLPPTAFAEPGSFLNGLAQPSVRGTDSAPTPAMAGGAGTGRNSVAGSLSPPHPTHPQPSSPLPTAAATPGATADPHALAHPDATTPPNDSVASRAALLGVLKSCVAWDRSARPQNMAAVIGKLRTAVTKPTGLHALIAQGRQTDLARARLTVERANRPNPAAAQRTSLPAVPTPKPDQAAGAAEKPFEPPRDGRRHAPTGGPRAATGHEAGDSTSRREPRSGSGTDESRREPGPGRDEPAVGDGHRRRAARASTTGRGAEPNADVTPAASGRKRRGFVVALRQMRRIGKTDEAGTNWVLMVSMMSSLLLLGGLVAYAVWRVT